MNELSKKIPDVIITNITKEKTVDAKYMKRKINSTFNLLIYNPELLTKITNLITTHKCTVRILV